MIPHQLHASRRRAIESGVGSTGIADGGFVGFRWSDHTAPTNGRIKAFGTFGTFASACIRRIDACCRPSGDVGALPVQIGDSSVTERVRLDAEPGRLSRRRTATVPASPRMNSNLLQDALLVSHNASWFIIGELEP